MFRLLNKDAFRWKGEHLMVLLTTHNSNDLYGVVFTLFGILLSGSICQY